VSWDYRRDLDGDDPDQQEPGDRRPAPGKVTLTSSLRPGPRSVARNDAAIASEYLASPVQRKTNPGLTDDAFGWDSWNESSSQRVQSVAAEGVSSPASALPYAEQIQRSFGRHDISSIDAHVGGAAAESSHAIGATAFAIGNHVAFAGVPDLHTAAHEAAHVIQQRSGVQLKGGVGEVGDTYEQHADAVADKVVSGESAEALLDQFSSSGSSGGSHGGVQRAVGKTAPEAAFSSQLRAELIVQTPRPLRLEPGKPGTVYIVPKSEQPLPANASPIPLYCKLLDKVGRPVVEGSGFWHPMFVVGTTFSLTVPATGARQIELHVNAGRPGARVLTRPLDIDSEETDREKAGVERETIKTKLNGLEAAFQDYRAYQEARGRARMADLEFRADFQSLADDQGRELEILLKRHGFASLKEFEGFIHKFETAFEKEGVNITNDVLLNYKARLETESAQFRDPAQIAQLHAQLSDFRYEHGELEKYGNISNAYARDSERARLPGQGQLQPKIGPAEQRVAYDKAIAAQKAAKESLAGLAEQYSIFDEGDLPVDHRINKPALARADEKHLAALLQAQVARRMNDVSEAQAQVKSKPRLIYQMNKLMPQFYARQGVSPGSIYDLIIKDKIQRDESNRLVLGIALSIVAIAVAVATGGSATPAIAAAGGAAGLGLGAYGVYTAYKEYEEQQDLADVGFADEPSTAWLLLAILGAGFDAGMAFKSMRALAPAARALHASGDVDAFAETVKALEKSHAIEARIARTAEKAAEAKKTASDAWAAAVAEFSKKVGSNGGGLFEEKVLQHLKTIIAAKTKQGIYTFQMFIDELRKARATLKLAEMTPEELASVKQAWAEAIEDGDETKTLRSSADHAEPRERSSRTIDAIESAEDRAKRFEDLSRDPDHGGKITPASRAEAEAVMGLEDAGVLPKGMKRPPTRDGSDFHDPTGQKWDVKAPRSRMNLVEELKEKARAAGKPEPRISSERPIRGEFTVEATITTIRQEIAAGEKIILDARNMQPGDIAALRDAISKAGLDPHIRFFPP
jgi:hypothetical protein